MDIGLHDDATREATLAIIIGARLSESGRYIVALDVAPPYVKVFDRHGRWVRGFVRTGDGPGEARHPTAVAVSGDTAVLVVESPNRLMVFGLDGKLRAQAAEERLMTLSAVPGCAHDWLLYGPRFSGNAQTASWLHRATLSSGGELTSDDAFSDSLAAGMMPFGVAYGLVTNGHTAALWHTLGARDALVRWDCGSGRPLVELTRPGQVLLHPSAGPSARLEVHPGMRTLGGIATVPGGVVIAEHVLGRQADDATTTLTLETHGHAARRITIPGEFILRDSRDGVGVLVSSNDPVPHLFLISQRDLRNLFH